MNQAQFPLSFGDEVTSAEASCAGQTSVCLELTLEEHALFWDDAMLMSLYDDLDEERDAAFGIPVMEYWFAAEDHTFEIPLEISDYHSTDYDLWSADGVPLCEDEHYLLHSGLLEKDSSTVEPRWFCNLWEEDLYSEESIDMFDCFYDLHMDIFEGIDDDVVLFNLGIITLELAVVPLSEIIRQEEDPGDGELVTEIEHYLLHTANQSRDAYTPRGWEVVADEDPSEDPMFLRTLMSDQEFQSTDDEWRLRTRGRSEQPSKHPVSVRRWEGPSVPEVAEEPAIPLSEQTEDDWLRDYDKGSRKYDRRPDGPPKLVSPRR